MFGIGTTEIVVILVVALLVLGPKKLPEIAKSLGKTLGEFRRVTTDVKRTIEMEADQEEQTRAKKRIKSEMNRKPSKESPLPEEKIDRPADDKKEDPYAKAGVMSEPADVQPESDKKNGTT